MLHWCETSITKLQYGEKRKEEVNHSCLIISLTSAMLMSIWEYLVVMDMAKVKNLWVMLIVLQRACFLTGSGFRKMLGNMKEVFIFLWFKTLGGYRKNERAGKFSPTWAAKWRIDTHDPGKPSQRRKFWNNNVLLGGAASSIIQPSHIMHKWFMHPLGDIYIWEMLRVFLSCFTEKNVWGDPGSPQPIFII